MTERVSKSYKLGDVHWWGWSHWYKWRWNVTHIDLGPISIYNLRCMWFWRIVAFAVVPLRVGYHLYATRKP